MVKTTKLTAAFFEFAINRLIFSANITGKNLRGLINHKSTANRFNKTCAVPNITPTNPPAR